MNHPFRQYYSAESTSNLKLRVVVFQVSGHSDAKPITSLVEAAEEEERKRKKKQQQQRQRKKNKNKNGESEDSDADKNGMDDDGGGDDDDDDSAAVTRFEQSFRWQEKLFSPQEIYRLLQDPARSAARAAAAVAAGGDPASTATTKNARFLENQYRALLHQQHAGKSAKELIKPIMLFNYIDKDSYVQSKRRLTSSHMEETTPLAQQMMSLNAGFQANPGGSGADVRSWIETTATDMAHISKDFKFRTMQIMLASNVSMEEHHELGFDGEAKTAGVAINRPAIAGVTMSETMLASVRAFANSSRIDIQPPLNPRGRDDPFLAPGSQAPDVGEPFWYTLVTSQGQTFRYTLFNESELGEDEQVVLDAVRQKEHELYEREQANLQNQVGFTFHGAPALHFASRVHALLEIVSASEFIGAEFLYVRYKLLLPPRGWEHTSQVIHGGNEQLQGDSSIASHGSTQTSRVVFRPPRFDPSVHHRFGSSVKEESLAHFCYPVEFNVQLRETVRLLRMRFFVE
eukprot:INCI1852.2.p1 GENE.INCI1852.2~~INCI1852.2.p1  ORF type:complete len:515 (-),score=98.42 INCI1852.2:1023-2567(-)